MIFELTEYSFHVIAEQRYNAIVQRAGSKKNPIIVGMVGENLMDMQRDPIKVVFMGTPEFAVPSLEQLINHPDVTVTGVVTAVDKLGGRGRKQRLESAVKKAALRHELPVLQPTRLKAPDFLQELRSLEADVIVVVAFRMLPEEVWSMPPKGTINLHASLLPAYRGAAPINWAIIKGESRTGLTTFFIDHQIDTGQLLYQVETEIGDEDNAGTLHDRLKLLGSELVLKTVLAIRNDTVEPTPQDESKVSKAPKIFREDCEIDFDRASWKVHNFIRGLSPYPGAWTRLSGQILKILDATPVKTIKDLEAGDLVSDGKSWLLVGTADEAVSLKEVQMEGRKRMKVDEFLNGFDVKSVEGLLLVDSDDHFFK